MKTDRAKHGSFFGVIRGHHELAARFWVVCGVSLLAWGCDAKNPDALPEWTPGDHDNQESPAAGQVDTSQRSAMPDLEKHGITDVVLATWKQNCVRCHGVIGRGDGPDGRALRPRDLSNPTWQRVALDSEIRRTIEKGRGKMPAFGHLPDETISGLIQLIRMLGPRAAGPDAESPGVSPSAASSAAPDTARATSPSDPPAAAQPTTEHHSPTERPTTESPAAEAADTTAAERRGGLPAPAGTSPAHP